MYRARSSVYRRGNKNKERKTYDDAEEPTSVRKSFLAGRGVIRRRGTRFIRREAVNKQLTAY